VLSKERIDTSLLLWLRIYDMQPALSSLTQIISQNRNLAQEISAYRTVT
jgi:hypothetical protein